MITDKQSTTDQQSITGEKFITAQQLTEALAKAEVKYKKIELPADKSPLAITFNNLGDQSTFTKFLDKHRINYRQSKENTPKITILKRYLSDLHSTLTNPTTTDQTPKIPSDIPHSTIQNKTITTKISLPSNMTSDERFLKLESELLTDSKYVFQGGYQPKAFNILATLLKKMQWSSEDLPNKDTYQQQGEKTPQQIVKDSPVHRFTRKENSALSIIFAESKSQKEKYEIFTKDNNDHFISSANATFSSQEFESSYTMISEFTTEDLKQKQESAQLFYVPGKTDLSIVMESLTIKARLESKYASNVGELKSKGCFYTITGDPNLFFEMTGETVAPVLAEKSSQHIIYHAWPKLETKNDMEYYAEKDYVVFNKEHKSYELTETGKQFLQGEYDRLLQMQLQAMQSLPKKDNKTRVLVVVPCGAYLQGLTENSKKLAQQMQMTAAAKLATTQSDIPLVLLCQEEHLISGWNKNNENENIQKAPILFGSNIRFEKLQQISETLKLDIDFFCPAMGSVLNPFNNGAYGSGTASAVEENYMGRMMQNSANFILNPVFNEKLRDIKHWIPLMDFNKVEDIEIVKQWVKTTLTDMKKQNPEKNIVVSYQNDTLTIQVDPEHFSDFSQYVQKKDFQSLQLTQQNSITLNNMDAAHLVKAMDYDHNKEKLDAITKLAFDLNSNKKDLKTHIKPKVQSTDPLTLHLGAINNRPSQKSDLHWVEYDTKEHAKEGFEVLKKFIADKNQLKNIVVSYNEKSEKFNCMFSVSKNAWKRLQNAYEKLEEENFKEKLEKVTLENEILKQKLEKVTLEHETLKKVTLEHETLENETLKQKLEKITLENEALKQKFGKVTLEHETFKKEKLEQEPEKVTLEEKTLKQKLEEVTFDKKTEIEKLTKKIEEFEKEFKKEKSEKETFKQELEKEKLEKTTLEKQKLEKIRLKLEKTKLKKENFVKEYRKLYDESFWRFFGLRDQRKELQEVIKGNTIPLETIKKLAKSDPNSRTKIAYDNVKKQSLSK